MSDSVSPNGIRHALVLGGGGAVGICWMTGLAIGLREAGIDLSLADRFVGTSAGAVVGAVLTGHGDLQKLLTMPPPDSQGPQFDASGFGEILGILTTPGLSANEARKLAGARALEMNVGDPVAHIARIGGLAAVSDWPEADFIVTAIDITTGELQPWTRDSAATLPEALASSTSVPGVFPPIPIGDHYYIDGGMRSPINADLAAGAEFMLIIEPLAHLFPHAPSDSELGGAATASIVPDADAITAFGLDLFSAAALQPAYEAGYRQAADAAPGLKAVWPSR
ncbi:patatin-like phospholipase family protein [Nocardia sp. NBC_01503]|uniref:patatin-like phospholipase family protein n=1 Tax=Nocardia sp. NBC_01503 TaxID=2975997 RepID=UPI002E7AF50D|nr:patatin-like phospholipase family protein [Nocardia sp. NBC_01503]WTL30407.1 patatin-like phospholipase family protein [Nocardia sp. NBC_01503]